ncbi:MAG: pyridoxal phosphate-dependent aminotransferase [Alphaproteobacteria bacterium]
MMEHLAALSSEARAIPDSGIVEIFRAGLGREGLIPLWVGEGDLPTPDFISNAAIEALRNGETFYTYQRGIPELREALVRYHRALVDFPFDTEMFTVTGSGMAAVQMAVRCIASKGDEVVLPSPAWPNQPAAVASHGAVPVTVPMQFDGTNWDLDLNRLFDAVTPRTRALIITSPCNPTGWVMPQAQMDQVMAFARQRGIWVVCDEVYTRYYFGPGTISSFWNSVEADDLFIATNTFSKNWAMTGWRMGWIIAPPALGQTMENLVQYNTSGVPQFFQRAGVVALDQGEEFLAEQVARAAQGRDIVCGAFERSNRARCAWPDGGFYAFFTVDGIKDPATMAFKLVEEANVGVAPGSAFGHDGTAFARICFQRSPDQLHQAMDRLLTWLGD